MPSINNISRAGEGNPYNSVTLLTLITSLWHLLVSGIALKAVRLLWGVPSTQWPVLSQGRNTSELVTGS